MRRLLGRFWRTPPTAGVLSPPALPPGGSAPRPRELDYSRTLPGRLFILSLGLLVPLVLARLFAALPAFVEVFRKVVSLSLIGSGGALAAIAIWRNRSRLLWRVRRKLILSYVFLGLVPVVLVTVFVLAGGFVFYNYMAAYMFKEGLNDLIDDMQQIVETSAGEIARAPATAQAGLERKYLNLRSQYPEMSLAVVPNAEPVANPTNGRSDGPVPALVAGPWHHQPVPAIVPAWALIARGFKGVLVLPPDATRDEPEMVIRAAVPTPDGHLMVIGDLPLDTDLITRLSDRTGARVEAVSRCENGLDTTTESSTSTGQMFRTATAFLECRDWQTGRGATAAIRLLAPLGRIYARIAASSGLEGRTLVVSVAVIFGGLLLVIQGSALVMGIVLGRSITSAVHELFAGTERIRQGDFTYRIKIESRDQLGELAESFNRMSGSIVHLLHVQREKQRLDDELRIAREIQNSLLPVETPRLAGLGVADLCEPAREVGGDYYDFFMIGPRLLGVLIADVSGKGTSAALYMAELKGLMLALSHAEPSPRKLLINVNRLLAAHLDNRSFITMTYAVLDLDRLTLTCSRAGHTPLIIVSKGQSEVVLPEGMVLGLRLPGAGERFEQMLAEHTRQLAPGDVVVLYTDGITEAMDAAGELFGDAALARVLAANQSLDAAGIRERVLREVRAFVGNAEPHDDMTMVVLKIGEGAGT